MSSRRPAVLNLARRFSLAAVAGLVLAAGSGGAGAAAASPSQPASSCNLPASDGHIKHVISVMFDNTHFTRDDPNVPSDLEQMPSLLNFIKGNGTLVSHDHTPLIAHTATDILSSLTGLYGDKMGTPVANSFGFYDTNASAFFKSSFGYWTARLGSTNDNTYFMTTPDGHDAPAPWVPFTRAGCTYGAVASANTVLENTASDIPTVFGVDSPENQEQQNALNIPCGTRSTPPCTPAQQKAKNQPQADFVGIAVHCGRGDQGCAGATGARPDVLPDEPGGYQGFSGLFGAKYVDPRISPSGPVTDLNGNVIADSTGNPGFPGFDSMSASTSLGYVATMQEHGVPVTYAYISDAHDNHTGGGTFGPGQAGYVQQLKAYDDAFGRFFQRLAKDGINRNNTLFGFTSDEGDHFVGGAPSPAGCDGVTVPCVYSQIGELGANLSSLLGTVPPYTTWLGLVGPGVRHLGVTDSIWASHTDDRPTTLAVLGLKDDYQHEGRVLVEALEPDAVRGLGDADGYRKLAQVYEQLNSPVGQFGHATLVASTAALESGTATEDSVNTAVTAQLQQLGQRRDQLVGEMAEILDRPVSRAGSDRDHEQAGALRDRGLDLLQQAWLASGQ